MNIRKRDYQGEIYAVKLVIEDDEMLNAGCFNIQNNIKYILYKMRKKFRLCFCLI